MGCPSSLAALQIIAGNTEVMKQIALSPKSIQSGNQQIQDNWGIWSHTQKGKIHSYRYQRTLVGTAETYILDLPAFMQLNYISLAFNDATAKDIDIRIYDDPGATLYTSLLTLTTDTNLSIIQPGGSENKYVANSRISIVLANATQGKIVRIVMQLDEV